MPFIVKIFSFEPLWMYFVAATFPYIERVLYLLQDCFYFLKLGVDGLDPFIDAPEPFINPAL